MLLFRYLAVRAQDGVWVDDRPQPAQDSSRRGGQEEAAFKSESHPYVGAELPLHSDDLVV
ncbi:hypothetical protein OIE66_06575 [Nonomuraea sp. NBC_01738]|uniref:hypothetical protein n=1 Tax=Nonomuraea sp. NBC_01738 TaxID=2976003 RepID=UPI002E12D723|nr:hypothetical protein OIE66_06575 [Nonomuraea sp. NBC_01738]